MDYMKAGIIEKILRKLTCLFKGHQELTNKDYQICSGGDWWRDYNCNYCGFVSIANPIQQEEKQK